jgi:hypothetical protein
VKGSGCSSLVMWCLRWTGWSRSGHEKASDGGVLGGGLRGGAGFSLWASSLTSLVEGGTTCWTRSGALSAAGSSLVGGLSVNGAGGGGAEQRGVRAMSNVSYDLIPQIGRELSTEPIHQGIRMTWHGAEAMTNGDWSLRTLHRERGHHVVTMSVVGGAGLGDCGT